MSTHTNHRVNVSGVNLRPVAANPRSRQNEYVTALAGVASLTVACWFLAPFTGCGAIALIYLLGVLLGGMVLEQKPVLLAAPLSALTWDFVFIPPRFTLHIEKFDDGLMFVTYFVVALAVGSLTTRLRAREHLAAQLQLAEESERLRKTLLDRVSYELKKPVAAIGAASEALADSLAGTKGELARQLTTEIQDGSRRLNQGDEPSFLIFAADVLGTADDSLEILTATSGREGLEMAARAQPDLILLDYSLAETTGAEVCRELLQDEATAGIPVLMMSGHLPELANTAANYRNVVATLPKPFLSGALINVVEKILASGPPPKPPDVPPAPPPAAPEPTLPPSPVASEPPPSAPNVEAPPATPLPPPQSSSPNGNTNGHVAKSPTALAVAAPPAAGDSVRVPPQFFAEPAADAAAAKDVRVTFSLEILAMKLTPDFRMDSLRLAPSDLAVGLRVDGGHEIEKPLETGFRMGPMHLTPEERIGTILLIPTREPAWMPATGKAFAVSGVRAESGDDTGVVELTAANGGSMRVYLTMRFEFLSVELSPSFEVAAIVLRAREEPAEIWSGPGNTTAAFALEQAQLDSDSRLRELSVRAIR